MINPILYFLVAIPSASGDAPWRQTCERVLQPDLMAMPVRETRLCTENFPYPPVRKQACIATARVLACNIRWPLRFRPCVAGLVSEEEYRTNR